MHEIIKRGHKIKGKLFYTPERSVFNWFWFKYC